MKRILYIVSTLKRCGPNNQLSYILKYLDKSSYLPIVLTLSEEHEGDSIKEYFIDDLSVRVETLRLSRIAGFFLAKKNLKKFIKENKIDLVHSQGLRADGLVGGLKIPKVATLRNYPFYDYPMTYGKIKGYLMAKLHLNYLKRIDEARVVSLSISNLLKENNNYEIDHVQNGTDLDRFMSLEKKSLRKRLDIDIDKRIFISVGDLTSRKEPLLIIKAFKKANLENSKLIFLGNGPLFDVCNKEISSFKNIELVGKVANVHQYLGASDYFISASLAEGLPNTVLEAMACGLPCILSNIPPHKEIAQLNIKSSLFFEKTDIKGLTQKLNTLKNEDYEVMSEASKKIIHGYLSAELMSNNYQSIYSSLLGGK